MPDEADDPEVTKLDPAQKAVLEVGLGSSVWSYAELRDYAHQFEKRLLDVSGVARVSSTAIANGEFTSKCRRINW